MSIQGKTPGERVLRNRKHVTQLFWLGLILAVFGYIIVAASWPHTTVGFDMEVVQHGSQEGVFFGAALFGFGQIFMIISMVAWGVRYGIESAVGNRSLTEADFPTAVASPEVPPQYQV